MQTFKREEFMVRAAPFNRVEWRKVHGWRSEHFGIHRRLRDQRAELFHLASGTCLATLDDPESAEDLAKQLHGMEHTSWGAPAPWAGAHAAKTIRAIFDTLKPHRKEMGASTYETSPFRATMELLATLERLEGQAAPR